MYKRGRCRLKFSPSSFTRARLWSTAHGTEKSIHPSENGQTTAVSVPASRASQAGSMRHPFGDMIGDQTLSFEVKMFVACAMQSRTVASPISTVLRNDDLPLVEGT